MSLDRLTMTIGLKYQFSMVSNTNIRNFKIQHFPPNHPSMSEKKAHSRTKFGSKGKGDI